MKLNELLNIILVINLDRDKARLENVENSFKQYGLFDKYVRIPAVLGSEIPSNELKKINSPMRKPEIGCGLSHKKAWKYIIDNNLPNALIVEDDIVINEYINKLDKYNIPSDYDIVYLGYNFNKNNTCSSITPLNNRNDIIYVNNNVMKFNYKNDYIHGTYGYIISKDTAQKLYNAYDLKIAADIFMPKNKNLNIYLINPKPITHCYDFGSTTRKLNMTFANKNKENYYNKILYNNIKYKMYIFDFIRYIFIPFLIILSLIYLRKKNLLYFIIIILLIIVLFLLINNIKFEWYSKLDKLIDKNRNLISNNTVTSNCDSYFDPFKSIWTSESIILTKELLQKLSDILNKNNIPWSIFYGTMLGWAKHNKQPIPWDDDLDIVVSKKYKTIIEQAIKNDPEITLCDNLKNKLNTQIYSKICFKNKGLEIPYKYSCNKNMTWPFIDIFYYDFDGENLETSFGKIKMPSKFEYINTRFMDVPVSIFKNYKYILYQEYGASWFSICKSSPWNHRFEINIPKCIQQTEKCSIIMLDPSYDIENEMIENAPNLELKSLLNEINNSTMNTKNIKNNLNKKIINKMLIYGRYFAKYLPKNLLEQNRNYSLCNYNNKNEDILIPKIKNYLENHSQTIPKIIHQIWIGPRKPPMKWINTIKDFVAKNPDWKYKLWRDEDIAEIGLINSLEYDKMNTYYGKSDIIRCELLFRFGGIYIDADSVWLNRSFDELLNAKSGFFVALENNKENEYANSVIGSSQYNPISFYLVKNLQNVHLLCKNIDAFKSTGPYFLDKNLSKLNDIISVYPSYYFYPKYWNGNGKEKDSIETLKKKYPNSFLFQYGYSTNGYNDKDV